ncbi:MAG: hypothetical protein M1840_001047 [Geoglossum simile]|nr:MAG: hypothetical protein M1840_001047 [Geoglossum simile]
MSLPKEVEASYATIIDSILAGSDLNTVSAKTIRKGLQAAVEYDITHQKAAINDLIMARFDKFNAERAAQTPSDVTPSKPPSNGQDHEPNPKVEPVQTVSPPEEDREELSDVVDKPKKPPKKKRKAEYVDDDAKFAAMLQAEENSRARRTRGAALGKATATSRKKKRATKIKIKDEDSDMISASGEEKKRKVNRSSAFHKPLTLSTPLSELLGETTLSRPQTVSKIWAYVKERGLQDPEDKRHIRCDDAMRAVFKADKVHMFTMNKTTTSLLRNQLKINLPSNLDIMLQTAESVTQGNAPNRPLDGRQRGGNNAANSGREPSARIAAAGHNDEPGGGRAGRRGGRGRGQYLNQGERQRGGPREGRGGRINDARVEAAPPPPLPPPPGLGVRGTFGARPTGAETGDNMKRRANDGRDSFGEAEAEVCFICASPVVHTSVAPCNHRTCHICALRMRALYKTKACAHCRAQADYVIFTDDPSKKFEDFTQDNFAKQDNNLGIKYEHMDIFEDTVLLLLYNCPDPECDIACLGWPDLHRHVKLMHQKVMCDLCTRNKKVFTHEHELFTSSELRMHERFGDDNPGAIDQSGFKGHPECGFCRQRFYGDDELYEHCRDKHEKCHLCDRRSAGRQPQYYVDYNSLEAHFRKDHFLCFDRECQDKKFVVFDSEIDLKAHQLETHPNDLSKDARREARRIDLSGFDYRSQIQIENRSGRRDREGRGRGRGRDANADPIPPSSAQPLRRDELAYQRQMAIQSSQSASARTFGGQLTVEPIAARPSVRSEARAAENTSTLPSLGSLTISSGSPPPQEQARRLRHAAVTERACSMLGNDPTKVSEFRGKISAYRTSAVAASDLIDCFFSLFDTSTVELGKLIKELADLYENESKRTNLLKAWNDWRATNENYPALPGSSSTPSIGQGGARVLKLKSSTAQSSRSSVNRQGSWGLGAASSSSNPILPLPAGYSASANRAGAGRVNATPWATASSTTTSKPSSRTTASEPFRGTAPQPTTEAFPALPAAKQTPSMAFGYGPGAARRLGNTWKAPAVNAWGNGGAGGLGSGSASATASGDEGEGNASAANSGGRKKGNKNKKQTLFQWG